MRVRVGLPLLVGRRLRRSPVATTAALLAAALVAWVVTADRMRGMDEGPGTDLGGLGWFLGVWVTMTAAMMLPSAAPMVLTVRAAAAGRSPGRPPAATVVPFVAGYLAAWTAYGLLAYVAYRAVASQDVGVLAWDRWGPAVAGAAVALGGLYGLTPLRRACLRHCRTPLHFVMHRWRTGTAGAVAMGVEHGAWCLGCCLGLMLVLFAVGVMSVGWMAAVALVILAEKALTAGARLAAPVAAVLVVLGLAIAFAPSHVPGLTEPGAGMGAAAMPMGQR